MMLGLQRLRCRRVRKALWDFVAERLSEGALETVERHVAVCNACRREAESMRRAQRVLAAYRQETIPPPRSDWQALRARLETATRVTPNAAPAEHEGRYRRQHMPSRQFERLMAPRRNRWAHSLSRSGAFAALLLLGAFGYRNLRLPNPAYHPQTDTAAAQFKIAPATPPEAQAPAGSAPQAPAATDEAGDTWSGSGFPVLVVGNSDPASHADTPDINSTRPHNAAPGHRLTAAALTQHQSAFAPPPRHSSQRVVAVASAPSRDKTLHFRHYNPRPEDALPQSGVPEMRSVVNSVVPVDNRIPALQPVPSDNGTLY